jgi:signal transduction histidine kinase
MKRPSPSLHRRWLATLTRASAGYWWVQALLAIGSIVLSAVLLTKVVGPERMTSWSYVLRISVDVVLFFLITHVGLRPALRLFFLSGQQAPRHWAVLALWLLLLSAISLALSAGFDALAITDAAAITSVRFQAGSEDLAVAVEGLQFYALALSNLAATLAVWSAIYLGWHALRQRRRLQQQVRQARLDQLTRQLNPHFLFNAFNTIRGTIFENPQRAADLVTQLSELFRFHLSQAERSSQSLEEEWRLAQRYLAIEQARLEQRLKLDIALDPVCLPQSLPSLALLLLVENAIKHGIAARAEGGCLHIRARPLAEGWELEVSNPPAPGTRADGTRTGLANLRERLALGYGPAARLTAGQEGEQYVVRLRMPWR